MNLYWLYDMSNPILFLLIVSLITITGLSKTFFFPDFFKNKFNVEEKHSDFIVGFLTLTGAFLSITIGLIIVGTYEKYGACETTVHNEVSALNDLKRTINQMDLSNKVELNKDLSDYAFHVVNVEWQQQQKGIEPKVIVNSLNSFENKFTQIEPVKENDKVLFAHGLEAYSNIIKYREERIFSIRDGLPMSIYFILMLGLLINILVSWQIVVDSRKLEVVVYTLTGILAGSLVFIIVSMDNPYRGAFSVPATAFKLFLESTIVKI